MWRETVSRYVTHRGGHHKAWYIFYFPITFLQSCTHNAFHLLFLLLFFFLTRNQCWGDSASNIKAFWEFTCFVLFFPLHSTDFPLAHVTQTIPRRWVCGWVRVKGWLGRWGRGHGSLHLLANSLWWSSADTFTTFSLWYTETSGRTLGRLAGCGGWKVGGRSRKD